MKKLAFLIVAILTLLLMFTQSDASETVRLVACNFPPYEFEHPDGELRGFDIETVDLKPSEIVEAISNRMMHLF
jgi:hypothetical protein